MKNKVNLCPSLCDPTHIALLQKFIVSLSFEVDHNMVPSASEDMSLLCKAHVTFVVPYILLQKASMNTFKLSLVLQR